VVPKNARDFRSFRTDRIAAADETGERYSGSAFGVDQPLSGASCQVDAMVVARWRPLYSRVSPVDGRWLFVRRRLQ